jgi:hypothetical protein
VRAQPDLKRAQDALWLLFTVTKLQKSSVKQMCDTIISIRDRIGYPNVTSPAKLASRF